MKIQLSILIFVLVLGFTISTSFKPPTSCQVCNQIISNLGELKVHTLGDLRNAIDQVCDKVPVHFNGECKNYLFQNKEKLIRLIISGEPKESICSSIDSTCNGLIVDNLQEKNKTYPFCTACKFILTFIISQLDEDYTQKKIEKVLVKVCSKIPTFKEACMNLLRNFTSLLIQYLEQKLPPNTICKKLRLCNPIFESLELIISEERLANDKTDCEICTFVVDETQKKVHEVPVFEVKNLALNTCNSLTQTDKTKCKLFVKSLDTMTLNYIHNNYGSDFICGNNLLNVC